MRDKRKLVRCALENGMKVQNKYKKTSTKKKKKKTAAQITEK